MTQITKDSVARNALRKAFPRHANLYLALIAWTEREIYDRARDPRAAHNPRQDRAFGAIDNMHRKVRGGEKLAERLHKIARARDIDVLGVACNRAYNAILRGEGKVRR